MKKEAIEMFNLLRMNINIKAHLTFISLVIIFLGAIAVLDLLEYNFQVALTHALVILGIFVGCYLVHLWGVALDIKRVMAGHRDKKNCHF